MQKVFLGLGSNLGDRAGNLSEAVKMIVESAGTIISRSSVYETEPWGFESKSQFLNIVVCLDTGLNPSGLLGRILMIESELGRIRTDTGYSSRNIDIDILFYGDDIISGESVRIPHPRLHERRFVLIPLAEIAPALVHPVLNKTIQTLLDECEDKCKVIRYISDN